METVMENKLPAPDQIHFASGEVLLHWSCRRISFNTSDNTWWNGDTAEHELAEKDAVEILNEAYDESWLNGGILEVHRCLDDVILMYEQAICSPSRWDKLFEYIDDIQKKCKELKLSIPTHITSNREVFCVEWKVNGTYYARIKGCEPESRPTYVTSPESIDLNKDQETRSVLQYSFYRDVHGKGRK